MWSKISCLRKQHDNAERLDECTPDKSCILTSKMKRRPLKSYEDKQNPFSREGCPIHPVLIDTAVLDDALITVAKKSYVVHLFWINHVRFVPPPPPPRHLPPSHVLRFLPSACWLPFNCRHLIYRFLMIFYNVLLSCKRSNRMWLLTVLVVSINVTE